MSLAPELGSWGPRGVVLLTACVTWTKCSSALGLSSLISKMGLDPVDLISCCSFMWVSVEEDPSSSQVSSRLFLGSVHSDPLVSDGSGSRPKKSSNMT